MRQCLLAVESHSANGITYALLGLPSCGLPAEQHGLGDVLAVLGGIGLIVQVGFDLGHDTSVGLLIDLHEEGEDQEADDADELAGGGLVNVREMRSWRRP